jgi:hypothetical protein
LRWKKHPKPKGLAAVCSGPLGSDLTDGKTEYATVYPSDGDWHGPLRGWYWVSSSFGYVNTCNDKLMPTEAEAKAAAMAHVKNALTARKGNND